MPHISVVSPVYRAEGCVAELCSRLIASLSRITDDFEIVLVEDRSPDSSWSAIRSEAEKDPRVRGIRLARNFGQHRAITAGLDMADGDWVVVMDCDLQDPPEEIPRLYAKAQEGYEVVVAQFNERVGTTFRYRFSRLFWKGLSWLAGITFDHRVGNFRIMSRRVVENFREYREQLRFLGGIVSLMGFTSTSLAVRRDARFAGETSYSFRKLLSIAVQIAIAYSDKPLKLSVIGGLVIAGLAIVVGLLTLILGAAGIFAVSGWASVIFSVYLVGGLIIANLGVVGYYIGKIFDETKRRPLYVVESTTYGGRPASRMTISAPQGRVIWITGLSGAGKSTIAHEVVTRLRASGRPTVVLDGDELRSVFGAVAPNSGNHGRAGRLALAMQYSQLCKLLAEQGFDVVIATISLFQEIHRWNRENLPFYFEAYLRVPVEELRRRDPKGIYRRFDAGELTNVAGLDLAIDEPEAAHWTWSFDPRQSAVDVAKQLIAALESRKAS